MVATATRAVRSRHLVQPADAYVGRVDLWTGADFLRMLRTIGLGALVLGVCYFGAREADSWNTQLAWLAGGIAGCAIGALGMVGWLLGGFRACRAEVRATTAVLHARAKADGVPVLTGRDIGGLVSGPGMRHHHRPDCPLVRGKAVSPVADRDRTTAGLAPCGVCQP